MGLYIQNPNPNSFVRTLRKLYNNILHFRKGYNFTLWFLLAGALIGFACARLPYLDINNRFAAEAAPGEWFYVRRPLYKAGMLLHLASVLPASLLAPWQFVPAIRHKALLFHRLNGYLLILLLLAGNAGGLMIARHAFGGDLATQSFAGFLTIATVTSAALAYYNVKRLQIDQHRAWMIRCWVYMGVIITIRIITILAAQIISMGHSRPGSSGYYIAMPCAKLAFMGGNATAYPACAAGGEDAWTAVEANFALPNIENIGASLNVTFGMAGWIGLAIHLIGAEVYLALTPAEGERLRRVSFERQLERGMRCPGSAGLTVDRVGDAERWTPPTAREKEGEVMDGEGREGGEVVQMPGNTASLGWR